MHQAKPDKKRFQSLLAYAPYLRPYHGRLFAAAALSIVGSAAAIFFPMITRLAIDRHIVAKRPEGLAGLIILGAAMMLLANMATLLRIRIMARVGQNAIRSLRLDLFRHIQRLPLAYFDHIPVGKVMTRLTSDVDALAELLSGTIIQISVDLLTLVGFIAVMLCIDWRLALVAMAGLPLLLFVFSFLTGKIRKAEDDVREKASTVNANLQESLSGVKVIQAFWAGKRFGRSFQAVNQALLRANIFAVSVFAFFWPIVDFYWVAGAGVMLLYGGGRVLQGTLTVGTLAAFMSYSGQFFGPLHSLSQAYRVIQRALAGAVRIREIMKMEAEDAAPLPAMPLIRGEIEFAGVTFAYEPGRNVLNDINLKVRPGEMVALVGATGAGKSSIINLLCRFYLPQAGKILVDGVEINGTELASYRRQVALVLQEPFLFSGTIRDNLRYGKPEATEAEMDQALVAAGLKESFDKQGLNLDSVLHERGGNLSAGQRQLLSFARAILAEPRLIILDEATAHVDTITERRVQAAMALLLAGRTAFVIAHRLSTIQAADQILLIEDGHIVERGTHQELVAAHGRYWRFCREQNAFARGEFDADEEEPATGTEGDQ